MPKHRTGNSTPTLSIVIPFYDVEDYIGACLASIRSQTLTDFEAILVDDGSRDRSAEIAASYAAKDPRFRVITQENLGLGPARNTGTAHAEGCYITFVDSDDLVPWHAYEHMVSTLDSTGSSFVAANARRFNRSGGVRGSWLHGSVFRQSRLATHITETPALALDRMVWNKVYRRDFWSDGGFRFPPIRYEDYPVTLAAHLEALTVDMLATPLYYWRERESGDSITQQAFRYHNLLDRVRSAEMVFDVVDGSSSEIRNRTHGHLAEIDLTALVQAFGVVSDHDVELMVALGHRFADRLDPAAVARRPRFDRVQYAALVSGDVELLRELADYRASGAMLAARIRRRADRPWILENDYPGRGSANVSRSIYRMPRSSLRLMSRITEVRWNDDGLFVRGTANLLYLDARDADDLGLTLLAGKRRIPVPITRLEVVRSDDGRDRFVFEGFVDLEMLRELPWVCWPVVFQIYVRHSYLRRKLPLRGIEGGSPSWPGGTWLQPDTWVQTSTRNDGALQIVKTTRPAVVESVTTDGAGFVVEGRVFAEVDSANITVVRKAPFTSSAVPVVMLERGPVSRFRVRIDPDDLAAGETPEDPYTLQNSWDLRLAVPNRVHALMWPTWYVSVDLARDGFVYSLTSSAGNFLRAVREPPRVKADSVRFDGQVVVAEGGWWEPARPERMTWRRFLPNSDDHVDIECDIAVNGGRWSARALLADAVASLDGPDSVADWTLHITTSDGEDNSVVCTPRAGSLLPLGHYEGGECSGAPRRWSLGMVRDTVHLVVT